jgi:DNA-binding SARP family transcriptional activator
MDGPRTLLPRSDLSLDIRLFGCADVRAAGAPVKLAKRATTLAMLAFIILKRGQAIARESLAFTLFPEFEEAAAVAELRRCLYLTNKSLPDQPENPWLIIDAETVRWNESAGAFVDVIAFNELAATEETHAAAIELYTGDLLEDVYDDWVLAERERLRSRYLELLAESIDQYRARRAFGPASASAKRLLAADPWREDILRSLLAIRYESGDTAGALAAYDAFAKRLRDELGVAPMPETVAVRQSILRNETIPGSFFRPAAAAPDTAARPAPVLPFVGRERELGSLYAAWGRAALGTGSLVFVTGEAGVGKTRLAAELARRVQAEGGRVFVGTTSAPESTPYQAIVEALRSALPLLTARPPAPARREVLAQLLPELRDHDSPGMIVADVTPERATARIYDAIWQALLSLASPRPLLLVLEDLQWAGAAGIEAVGAIARELTIARILIIATSRDEETPPGHPLRALQQGLRTCAGVGEIALDRLGRDDVAELVTRVDGLGDRSSDLVRDLYKRSEGNPLFLNEAIAGALEHADSTTGSSFETIIASRVARLGSQARTVAEIAAVAGAGCSVSLIREVSNLPASLVARGLDELLDRRILREAGARTSYDYVFTHHLITEAIYREVEPVFRAQRHARIARLLEAGYRDGGDMSSREIARHYEAGGDAQRSAQWYLTAARQSSAVYAYGDTISLAGRGLDLTASPQQQAELHAIREQALGRRGDRDGQRADIDALERLAGADVAAHFNVLARRVALARTLGESDEEGRLIARMSALADDLGDGARARALVQAATHAGLRSRPADGLEPARDALAIFERQADVRGQLDCLFLLVDFTSNIGDIAASRAYLAQMHDRASSVGDHAIEARALAVAGTAALLRQEYQECFELTQRGLELNLMTGDREAEAASRGRLAVSAAWLADFRTGLREFELALARYESIGHKRGLALTYTNRTLLLMRLGLFDDALVSIERSNAYFATVHEQRTIVANAVNESFVKLQLGDAHAAKRLAQSALAAANEIGFPVFEAAALANVGNAERELGELEAAIEHMRAGIALRRPIQDSRDYADDLADLALAYAAAGHGPAALATAAELEAISGEDGFTGALWPHYPWWAIAQAHAACGEAAQATAAAARARSEMRRFAGRIDDPRAQRAFLEIPVNRRIGDR